MPAQPEEIGDLEEPLIRAYRESWADVLAQQQQLVDDPLQAVKRERLAAIRAEIEETMDEIAAGTRAWIESQLPQVYGLGAAGAAADAGAGEFVWSMIHEEAVEELAQRLWRETLGATKHVNATTKELIRTVGRDESLKMAIQGRTATDAGNRMRKILETKGISAVTYADGSKHGLAEYGRMAIRTETARAYNLGTLNGSGKGVEFFQIADGPLCGLSFHDDPTLALGLVVDRFTASKYLISHPNCRRAFGPRPDIRTPAEAKEAQSFITDAQTEAQRKADQALAAQQRRRAAGRARTARRGATKSKTLAARQAKLAARDVKTGKVAPPEPLLKPSPAEPFQFTAKDLSFKDKTGIGVKKSNAIKKAKAQGLSDAEAQAIGAKVAAEETALRLAKLEASGGVGAGEGPKIKPKVLADTAKAKVPSIQELIDKGWDPSEAVGEHERLEKLAKAKDLADKPPVDPVQELVAADINAGGTPFNPEVLYDWPTSGPGGPGAAGDWESRLFQDTGPGKYVPVRNLTVENHTIKDGIAVRRDGVTYVMETPPGSSFTDAMAAELEKHVKVAGGALKSVPADKRSLQKGIAILRVNNPSDAYWAQQYNKPDFKSAATGGYGRTVFWNTTPRPGLVLHEFGHTLDGALGYAPGQPYTATPAHGGWDAMQLKDEATSGYWAKQGFEGSIPGHAITPGKKGVTTYGEESAAEDFAESVRLYLADRHNGYFAWGGTGANKTSIRFADVYPEKAAYLDKAFGLPPVTTPFQVQARQKALDYWTSGVDISLVTPADLQSLFGVSRTVASDIVYNLGPKAFAAKKAKVAAEVAAAKAASAAAKAAAEAAKAAEKVLTKADLSNADKVGIGVKKANAIKKAKLSGSSDLEAQLIGQAVEEQEIKLRLAKMAALGKGQVVTEASQAAAGKVLTKADLSFADKTGIGVKKGNAYRKALKEGKSEVEAKLIAAEVERTEVLLRLKRMEAEGKGVVEGAQAAQTSATGPGKMELFRNKTRLAGQKWLNKAGKEVAPKAKNVSYHVDGQAKANIAATLANKLNNRADWELLRKARKNSLDNFVEGGVGKQYIERSQLKEFDAYTPEQRQLLLDQEISARVQDWAASSGDSRLHPVTMQRAIKEEFGTTGDYMVRSESTYLDAGKVDQNYANVGEFYRRVARVMYENTQEEFRKEGITHVSLYRGMRFSYGAHVPDWAQRADQLQRKGVAFDTSVDGFRLTRPELQPANSWSTKLSESRKFGSDHLFRAEIPVDRILGSARTGFGCLNEAEFVVLDSDGLAEVDRAVNY